MPGQQPNREFLEQMIKKAGAVTLEYFQKNFDITEKPDNQGIVTDADLSSENLIKKQIHSVFPDHDILAEESGLIKYSTSSQSAKLPMWIIDPLDGTTNFSKGNAYYCISIAFGYCINGRFKAELGAIFQPTTHALYLAEKGKGAFLNENLISISSLKNFHLASITTGFSSNKGESLLPLIKTISAIQNKSLGLRINGAAALDLAHTAKGIFQGFYETPLAPWDTAAGALLIQESGGKVTNFKGEEFCPINDRGIIASNNYLYDELFNIINNNYL
jgi:myo-inositol-1(or 4)-monophosphatase